MNHVKAACKQNTNRQCEFPEQRGTVFHQIAQRTFGFHGQGMAIDMHAFDHFIALLVALACGANDGDCIAGCLERGGFLPHAAIEWRGQILDNDEDAALCGLWRLHGLPANTVVVRIRH